MATDVKIKRTMKVVRLTKEGMIEGIVEVIVEEWKEEQNVIYVREPHAILPQPRRSLR